jgi:ATP-dependent DNA helicase 2 subunit 1
MTNWGFSPKALAYHNAQLEASAFREEFDPDSFEDLTEPKYEMIHKVIPRL